MQTQLLGVVWSRLHAEAGVHASRDLGLYLEGSRRGQNRLLRGPVEGMLECTLRGTRKESYAVGGGSRPTRTEF